MSKVSSGSKLGLLSDYVDMQTDLNVRCKLMSTCTLPFVMLRVSLSHKFMIGPIIRHFHFIWVFTVCQSTPFGFYGQKRLNIASVNNDH